MATPKSTRGAKKKTVKAVVTGTGKRASPTRISEAEERARAALRERTEQGHILAGRTPPSQKQPRVQTSGPTKIKANDRPVDFSIRDDRPLVQTEDEKLLGSYPARVDFTRTDPWRVMRIMGEFIEGFDNARGRRQGRFDLRLGAHASGRSAVPGGAGDARGCWPRPGSRSSPARGPGSWKRRTRARSEGGGRSIGCNIELPFEQGANPYVDTLDRTSATSSCGRRCSSSTRTRSSSSRADSARSTRRSRRSRSFRRARSTSSR